MTKPTSSSSTRRSRPPLWLLEGLEVVERRRRLLVATAAAVLVLGLLVAVIFPSVLAPTLVTGVGVGVAAVLLGIAATIAADATDLLVRGPRHVRASGGELVAVLPSRPSPEHAAPLATAVLEAREDEDRPLRIALAASGREVGRVTAWTDELALALAQTGGVSVLRVDLASGATVGPGLLEVVSNGVRLASAVEIREGVKLARMGAGADAAAALAALPSFASSLPRDLDVLLVALPAAASRQVVAAVGPFDHVLVVADRGRTSRVELIAGLDAIESAGTAAQVVLIDDVTSSWLSPTGPVAVHAEEPGVPESAEEPVTPEDPEDPGAPESTEPGIPEHVHAGAAQHEPDEQQGADAEPEGADAEPQGADAGPEGADAEPEGADAQPEGAGGAPDTADDHPAASGGAPDSAGGDGHAQDDVTPAETGDVSDDLAVDPRDVDVLIGAATANAEALTAAEIAAERKTGPWDARTPESEAPVEVHGDPDRFAGDADATDEIPRVQAPGRRHDDAEEDMIRTTAQLAILELAHDEPVRAEGSQPHEASETSEADGGTPTLDDDEPRDSQRARSDGPAGQRADDGRPDRPGRSPQR